MSNKAWQVGRSTEEQVKIVARVLDREDEVNISDTSSQLGWEPSARPTMGHRPVHYRLRPIKEVQFGFAHFMSHFIRVQIQGGFFLTGSALKVLSAEDGKIPTKKVKVGVKTSHILCDIPLLSLFW